MILSGGRTAYCGAATGALDYFASIGHAIPPNTNPAEFFLDLVNNDFVAQAEVDLILDAWTKKGADGVAFVPKASTGGSTGTIVPLSKQIGVMMNRHAKLVYMDPVLYIGRAIIFLVSNIYFALVYIKARERGQDQVLNRMVRASFVRRCVRGEAKRRKGRHDNALRSIDGGPFDCAPFPPPPHNRYRPHLHLYPHPHPHPHPHPLSLPLHSGSSSG